MLGSLVQGRAWVDVQRLTTASVTRQQQQSSDAWGVWGMCGVQEACEGMLPCMVVKKLQQHPDSVNRVTITS